MALASSAVWLVRVPLLIVFASLVGALLGVLEGAAYPAEGGPRIPLGYYWTTLAATLYLCLLAFARLVEPRTGRALFQALGLLPVTVVVQDAVSLLMQGSSPATATWYAAVFGDSFLTRQTGYAPGFYFVFAGASALLLLGSTLPSTQRSPEAVPEKPSKSKRRKPRRSPQRGHA